MQIFRYIYEHIFRSRFIRQITGKLSRSMLIKVLIIGIFLLVSLAFATYYIEKDYLAYSIVNGEKVATRESNIKTLEDSIWWSFVTSTTVGYGDFYPISRAGRFMGILLMFFGMSLVGVITGNIASFLVEKQLKEGKGLKDLKLKNHFIICGWKRDMVQILHDVMEKNKHFLPSEIVLINMADPEEIENIKSDEQFSQINFISGDFIDERVLHRANLKHAQKVLVLADRLVPGSVQEVDSRTVMAIITIKSITKSAYTCAELVDKKFERYLKFSNCDEIILSSEYNRSLIANASAGSGISHIISELLNVNADVSITTQDVPDKYIGLTYDELFSFYMSRNRSVLIGLLENTGNFFSRKTEAIRDAQKTPDISKLVDNLKEVKTLEANQPVINPYPDYILKKYSKAIIIEGRE
ncbi:MAG: transporter [Spirochaetae bacterium HGW-Spirochaetae-1]|jgi:voltage-gated potassium channel|nr:MAG: transporter [Spirochaetae bacterium HGW-Spirochaetae-1]